MIGYVYITTNLINQKQYIGLKTSTIFQPNYLGSGKIIKKAIKKYGKENFKVELIEECDSIEELRECERKWIKYYNAQENSNFYNIAEGGQWGNNIKGMTPEEQEQYRKLLSQRIKESYNKNPELIQQRREARHNMAGKIVVSDKDKLNRSERLKQKWVEDYDNMLETLHKAVEKNKDNGIYENMWKERQHPWTGRKHSEETKKKISEHTDNHGVNNPNARSGVILLNNEVIFKFDLTKEVHPFLEEQGFIRKERRKMLKGEEIRGYKIQREGATTIENTNCIDLEVSRVGQN